MACRNGVRGNVKATPKFPIPGSGPREQNRTRKKTLTVLCIPPMLGRPQASRMSCWCSPDLSPQRHSPATRPSLSTAEDTDDSFPNSGEVNLYINTSLSAPGLNCFIRFYATIFIPYKPRLFSKMTSSTHRRNRPYMGMTGGWLTFWITVCFIPIPPGVEHLLIVPLTRWLVPLT